MTKEQEEAIKDVKIYIHDIISESVDEDGYTRYEISEEEQEFFNNIETLLNMLTEKDAEIEKYKKKNKELSNQILILYKEQDDYNARIDKKNTELKKKDEELEMYKDIKEIANSKVTELAKFKQYDDLKEENRKKDKMIDLMAEHICSSAVVDDTVCAIKCDCETDINEDCTHVKMLNCTKQYFERKATNDG